MNSDERNNKPDDNITEIPEEQKKKEYSEVGVKKKIIPLLNYKLNPILSAAILNYLFIGISMAIFGCEKINLLQFDNHIDFYKKYYLISGIVLYISGIFDWYDGKELLFLVDFVLSFFLISEFLSNTTTNENFFHITGVPENEKLRGTFYVIFFLFFFCISISYKNKGKLYIVDHATLFIGFIFLFLYKYFEQDWMSEAYSYSFIVIGGLFWLTGLLKMIDNLMTNKSIILLMPSD
jgi:hypothetical protein